MRALFICILVQLLIVCVFSHPHHHSHSHSHSPRHHAHEDASALHLNNQDSPFWDYHPFITSESGSYPPWTPDAPILSWHIHVYFLITNKNQTNTALTLRDSFLKQFQPIPCAGDCDTWCPQMCVWPVNFGPRGPHPVGSFGIYLPLQVFPQALAYISSHHAGLSILVHPNTGYPIIDHGSNAFWMQQILPLDLSQLIPYEPNTTRSNN